MILPRWLLAGGILGVLLLAGALSFAGSYYTARGVEQYKRGDFVGATGSLRIGAVLSLKNPWAHFYQAKIALGKPATDPDASLLYPDANYPETIVNYETAITSGLKKSNKELYAAALNDLGFSYWMTGQFEKADSILNEKIALEPDQSVFPRYLVATDYFVRFNKPREALAILEPALTSKMFPITERNFYKINSLLSRLYYYAGKIAQAEEQAKLALTSASDKTDYYVQVAHLILAQVYGAKRDFEKAQKEINEANVLANDPTIHNCMVGKVYYDGDAFSKAITSIKPLLNAQAAAKVPYGYSICLSTIAKAYEQTGNTGEAKNYFSQYIKFTDSFEEKNIFVNRDRENAQQKLMEL